MFGTVVKHTWRSIHGLDLRDPTSIDDETSTPTLHRFYLLSSIMDMTEATRGKMKILIYWVSMKAKPSLNYCGRLLVSVGFGWRLSTLVGFLRQASSYQDIYRGRTTGLSSFSRDLNLSFWDEESPRAEMREGRTNTHIYIIGLGSHIGYRFTFQTVEELKFQHEL